MYNLMYDVTNCIVYSNHKLLFQVSTDLLMETFWDIVEHMIVKKSFKYIDEVLRVRAIVRWMTSFDIDTIEMELLPPENSPIEYLINIQQDFGDHCHLFYALCQYVIRITVCKEHY